MISQSNKIKIKQVLLERLGPVHSPSIKNDCLILTRLEALLIKTVDVRILVNLKHYSVKLVVVQHSLYLLS